MSALRCSVAAPAIRDIQRSDRSRWYARHKRPRRNVVRHDRSGRDDGVVANGYARKDRRRTADPDVGSEANRGNPRRARRFELMVVGVEDGHEVSNQTIVAENYAVSGHDRGP